MYDDLITLTPPLQHSSGSSPYHHMHASCFDFIWLICFPTSFYISLSLLSCCVCPPLYFFPASHPASLYHVFPSRCFLSSLPGDPQSPCISAFLTPSLPTLWHPKWLCFLSARFFSQLLQSLGVPFLSQKDNSCSGPNSCIAFAGGLCELPLHCRPLWDPWFTAPLPWRLQ